MDYETINGYKITPYDMYGTQCWAIRDGKIGCLIRNYRNVPLIVGKEEFAIKIAESIPHCSKLINFTTEEI